MTHKLRLIEHAAGIAGADATTWVDQIQYLNDELDRKQNDLTQYKVLFYFINYDFVKVARANISSK